MNMNPADIHRVTSNIQSEPQFVAGMQADAAQLGDAMQENGQTPKWIKEFLEEIHVVFSIAGDSRDSVNKRWSTVEEISGGGAETSSINMVYRLRGNVRPDGQEKHEQ